MEINIESSILAVNEAVRENRPKFVMYLIVNTDLNMSTGKIAGQVGHGVDLALQYYFNLLDKITTQSICLEKENKYYCMDNLTDNESKIIESYTSWLLHGRTKVVLKASLKQFEKIKSELDYFLVRDAGLTEIEANSETVLSFPPILKEECPKLIKKLQAL